MDDEPVDVATHSHAALPQGTTLLHYEILEPIGQGGMGQVYRARDLRLGRTVALKMLRPELARELDRVQRFEREASAASALNHPHIVSIFDTAVVGDRRVIVMELIEGRPLDRWLAETRPGMSEVLDVMTQVADALAAAHDAGIVHRDVKPGNLLVTRQGYAKVVDFGLAKVAMPAAGHAETASLTRSGVVMGTVAYMSPEQALGRPVDPRTDVFAAGAVLFEAITGVAPFRGATVVDVLNAIVNLSPPAIAELRPDAPAGLQWVIDKALAKAPGERQQSMHELAADLRRLRRSLDAGASGLARAAGSATPAPRRRGARAAVWLLGAAVLAACAWALGRRGAPSPAVSEVPAFEVITLASAAMHAVGPAISPDGKWVTYVGMPVERSDVFVQFVGGGAPVNLTAGVDLPIQNRSIVGGLAVSPDGSNIAFGLRVVPRSIFSTGGVFVVPAPVGGAVRLAVEEYAALRWSPDGQRVALIRADPLRGDALLVADHDGQNVREIIPSAGALHVHQPAWSHDGAWIYFTRGIEVNSGPTEIWRAPVGGGAPEPVVRTSGLAMNAAPTADGPRSSTRGIPTEVA